MGINFEFTWRATEPSSPQYDQLAEMVTQYQQQDKKFILKKYPFSKSVLRRAMEKRGLHPYMASIPTTTEYVIC